MNATFVIHDIVEVNEINGYAVITIHFVGYWFDRRVALPCYPPSGLTALSHTLHDSVWRPQTMMIGVTQGLKQSAPILVQGIEVRYDGKYCSKIKSILYCIRGLQMGNNALKKVG